MPRITVNVRVYPEERKTLLKELSKRLKAWDKSKKGDKPWICDIIKEIMERNETARHKH